MSTTPSFGFPQIINDSRTGFSQETNCLVMLGLVPGVHVFPLGGGSKTWIAGTSPAMTA